jgi:predicted TIM-barrel fold metal-dependent hydrolase
VKIDVFPHILPPRYFERMLAAAPPGMAAMERMRASVEDKAKIYEGNARRMLRLRLS